jgi:signal transduction histidine kinase
MHVVQIQDKGIADSATQEGLLQARLLTETALATMRRISHELMPPQLERYGLIKTLEALTSQINTTEKISIDLATPQKPQRWSAPIELGLYRIAMEMINNTLKHAGANRISIQIKQLNGATIFNYADDGKGLPPDYTHGQGFKNIEARVTALGGLMEIGVTGIPGFYATITIPQNSSNS